MLSGVSPFIFIPTCGITVMMVLPVHNKLQYVRHICAALSMLPQVFNLGMEWRYKTKINYPIELLAEVKHCFSYSTTL